MKTAVILLLLGISATSQAALDNSDLPTPFGVRFYAADAPAPQPLPPLRSAPEADAWEQRIKEGEYVDGPYGAALSETLQDAGNYFYSRGDYRNAIAYWRRSVHLTRVNEGLYTERQLPTLQRLLDTYLDLGDFESADEVQSYLWHLSRQHHEPGDLEWIEASLAWVDWQREQWLRAPNPEKPKPLLTLWRLLDRQSRETDEKKLTLEQLEPLVYGQLDLLYVIGVSEFGMDRESEMMMGRAYGGQNQEPNIDRSQIQVLQEAAYGRGRKRLEELAERMGEAGNAVGQARALKALGDWHMWYNSPMRAGERYRESWQLVTEAGDLVTRSRWFAQPVELPAGGVLWVGPGSPDSHAASAVINARFTVTARGRVENLKAEAQDPEAKGKATRLYRMLRGGRFRPRMADGDTVDTEDFFREYRVY